MFNNLKETLFGKKETRVIRPRRHRSLMKVRFADTDEIVVVNLRNREVLRKLVASERPIVIMGAAKRSDLA